MAISLNDITDFTKQGVKRVKQTPLSEYFLPTSKSFKRGLITSGKLLQKTPSTKIELPDLDRQVSKAKETTGPIGLKETLAFGPKVGGGIINQATQIPREIIRSYGTTVEKLGLGNKLGFEDYLNLSDLIPGIGFIGVRGVKPIIREAGEKAFKTAGREVAESLTKKTVKEFIPKAEAEFISANIKGGINVLDYLRTPEQVLDRIGLGKEAKQLRRGFDGFQTQLKTNLEQIDKWRKSVPKESNRRIFDYLDGQAIKIEGTEKKVAEEIQSYLKGLADQLGLPEEKRVSNYITHLFRDVKLPETTTDKVKAKISLETFNPFEIEREGLEGYAKDTWRALEAYSKVAVRKINMDDSLIAVSRASSKMDAQTLKYIQKVIDHVNLKPNDLDVLMDRLLKKIPVVGKRIKPRPTARFNRAFRRVIYRGALGMNVGSAMKNLTQGVSTYAKLGEKYTTLGYVETIKRLMTNDFDELVAHNVLGDNFIQDRELGLIKGALEKLDPLLFKMFDFAEKINRSSAYFGAKKKALAKGMTGSEAIESAKELVAKTQFKYDRLSQPVALQSELAKTLTQFKSFDIKQTEFLAGLFKDEGFKGVLRYIIGSLVIAMSYGKIFGMGLGQFVPLVEGRFGTPASDLIGGLANVTLGNEKRKNEGKRKLKNFRRLLIPAGQQLKKTSGGIVAGDKGYVETKQGNVKFPVKTDPLSKLQLLLLGPYSTTQARRYFNRNQKPLNTKQSEIFRGYGKQGPAYFDQIMKERLMKEKIGSGKVSAPVF